MADIKVKVDSQNAIKARVGSQNAIKVISTSEAKSTLDGLLDVDLSGVSDGMVLFYNQSNSRWESGIIDGGTYWILKKIKINKKRQKFKKCRNHHLAKD